MMWAYYIQLLVCTFSRMKNKNEKVVWSIYRNMPLNVMSRWWGWVSQLELPSCTRPTVIGFYAWLFKCRLDEAAVKDFKEYVSLSEFFRRCLTPGIRPIDEIDILICPCDGTILHLGEVFNGLLEQVKDITYNLSEFFGPPDKDVCQSYDQHRRHLSGIDSNDYPENEYMQALLHKYENRLYFCTIYLGPGDYHRFHAPAKWTVRARRYFPGNLFSVNPSIAKRLKGLFGLNERAIYFGKWYHGFFSLAAVGATNVGSINVYCDEDLITNPGKMIRSSSSYHGFDLTSNNDLEHRTETDFVKRKFNKNTRRVNSYGAPIRIKPVSGRPGVTVKPGGSGVPMLKGEMIGDFNFGSTIVLVFEAPHSFKFRFKPGDKVKYGQGLGSDPESATDDSSASS